MTSTSSPIAAAVPNALVGANTDNYYRKLRLQINWTDRPLPAHAPAPEQASGESARTYGARCERELLRRIRQHALVDVVALITQRPHTLRRFGTFFTALRGHFCSAAAVVGLVRHLAVLANFRRAPLRSALSRSFIHLCLSNRDQLGDLLIDVIIDRRPSDAFLANAFAEHSFSLCDFALVRRWARETSYALPFHAFFPPAETDADGVARTLAALARQGRLEFNRTTVSSRFVDVVLAHSSDVDFLLLAQLYVRRNAALDAVSAPTSFVFRSVLEEAQAIHDYVHGVTYELNDCSFCLDGRLAATAKRRYEYLMIFEHLLALAPLRLPVYLGVEILSWLSPMLGASHAGWLRCAAVATNIGRAYAARQRRTIQNSPDSKRCKKP